MLKFTEIYHAVDGKSYFREQEIVLPHQLDLGNYSQLFQASGVIFWQFDDSNASSWHTAPQTQFVVVLSGTICVETSGGEAREFSAGDILLANNLEGEGHQSKAVTAGCGMLIPREALGERLQSLFAD